MVGEEASSDEEVFDAAKAAEQAFKLQKKTRKEIVVSMHLILI